jgi:S1-C subfamily serine protease
MRRATSAFVTALVAAVALSAPGPAAHASEVSGAHEGNGISASVVHVQVYRSGFDWSMPWRQKAVQGALGSGFLIAGGRIVTNAHVVADARQILVRRPDQANPRIATVEAVAHDADLAVLRVEDPTFFEGLGPLTLGELPRAGSQVLTYGFPLGGQDVSSTAGIVSRVEMRSYVHSGPDAHLVVQTDAAINPGNSGGPVVQDGRVVGVAFQGFPGFDNMGFFIPIPVVRHFLQDLEDGTLDGFPDSGLETSPLLSPAYRRERGLPESHSGVVVNRVVPGGTADGVVEPGDVLLEVDGQKIANDGTVGVGDARVTFQTLFDARQIGDAVRFGVWRGEREVELTATARRVARYDGMRNRYDVAPRYVVHAGLVFMPLEAELLKMFGRNWAQNANRDLVWHQVFREAERPEEADREVIVLVRVLRHSVNSQMSFTGPVAVEAINSLPIRSLEDVIEAFGSCEGRFDEIVFEGDAGIEALDREKAKAAHEEILQQYAITHDRRLQG